MKSGTHTFAHHSNSPDTFRVLLSITREEDERQVAETFRRHHIPLFCELRGKGTAPSEFLDILGLGGSTRILTFGCVPTSRVPEIFTASNQALSYHRRGTGIALTFPLTGAQRALASLLRAQPSALSGKEERSSSSSADRSAPSTESVSPHQEAVMSDTITKAQAYSLIWTSVNTGYSDAVIDAARGVGARGGTILHGRRIAGNAGPYLGIDGQEEQDFVMIVVPEEKKTAVMQAITASCGLNTPAHGVVLSLPVDEAMGLA